MCTLASANKGLGLTALYLLVILVFLGCELLEGETFDHILL